MLVSIWKRKLFGGSLRWISVLLTLGMLASVGCRSTTPLSPEGTSPPAVGAEHTVERSANLAWPHEQSDLKPDPQISFGRLSNGFRYALLANRNPRDRVSMHLNIQAGSLHETDEQQGLAHFLEHLMFNGSTHYPPGELIKYFQSIGMQFGPDANAHTGFDETVYDILLPSAKPSDLKDGLRVLKDYAEGALLLPAEIDRERKVVLAEKRTRDSATYRTFVKTFEFEFPDALVSRRLPIGQVEVIAQADRKQLKAYYDTWYRPDKMILVMVGDFDVTAAQALIEASFADLVARAPARPEPEFGRIEHEGVKTFYHHEKEAGSTRISIEVTRMIPPEPDTAERRRRQFLLQMANQMLNNRLDKLIRQPDSSLTSASAHSGIYLQQIEYAEIGGEANPAAWRQALGLLEQSLRQALTFGFTEIELQRVKQDSLADLDNAVKSATTRRSTDLSRQLVRHLNNNKVFTSPAQDRALLQPVIQSVTLQQVTDAFQKAWSPDHRLILVTGNVDLAAAREDPLLAIQTAYEESHHTAVARPEIQEVLAFPYLAEPRSGGQIIKRTTHTDLGIVQIDFSNEVRLNYKQTDYQADEVLINLSFGPGRSAEPKGRPGLAVLSEEIINESGLGAMNKEELERALAGKLTRTHFEVEEGRFLFKVKSVSSEIPLALQLLHAYVVDPGFNPEAYRLVMERYRQSYRQLAQSVEGVMRLNGERFLAGGDGRFGLPSFDQLQQLSLEEARNWLLPYITGSLLEISVVGDFEPAVLETAVARYLGTLPPRKQLMASVERTPPVFPAAQHLQIDVDTSIPKGLLVMAFPTDDIWDIERTRRLSALSDLFSERLRVQVREKLGAAYSPYAYHRPSRAYRGFGVFRAVVFVDPQDIERVGKEVKAIAQRLQGELISTDELKRVIDPMLTGIKDLRQTNRYWLESVLTDSRAHPEQLQWSRTISKDIAAITAGELKALAREYLNDAKIATIDIRPSAAQAKM